MNETFPVLITSKLLDQVIKAHARWRWRAWIFSAGPAGSVSLCLPCLFEMPLCRRISLRPTSCSALRAS